MLAPPFFWGCHCCSPLCSIQPLSLVIPRFEHSQAPKSKAAAGAKLQAGNAAPNPAANPGFLLLLLGSLLLGPGSIFLDIGAIQQSARRWQGQFSSEQ